MGNQKINKIGHGIYWFVVVLGAFLIPIFLVNQFREIQQYEMIKNIKELPHTAWFNYESIKSEKQEYKKYEKIFFLTTRTVVDNPPYTTYEDMEFNFEEFLFCDYGAGMQRVDPISIAKGAGVKPGKLLSKPRRRLGGTPDFLPSECELRSKVCIEVEGIKKCQFITSNTFKVNN